MKKPHKLVIGQLSKTFPHADLEVLKDVSLAVSAEEIVSLIGPSGSGKSTLLDCIAGLTAVTSGAIELDGLPLVGKRGRVSYMMQDDNLLPWRNVLRNVILPLEITGVKREIAEKEARGLLRSFGLEKFASYYPFMLSGGMRQRVSLLRTYLSKKDMLLLDEPFAKLDAITRRQMQEWFLGIWQKERRSVLLVTHDVDEAIFLSDRIYVLSKRPGKIVSEIAVDLKRPRTMKNFTEQTFLSLKKQVLRTLGE